MGAKYRAEAVMTQHKRDPPALVRGSQVGPAPLEGAGADTLDHLEPGVCLGLAPLLALAVDLAGALASLHARGLVHGSVRPGNLRWTPGTGALELLGPAGGAPQQRPAAVGAELAYVSPEQTGRTDRAVDPRADLYSLGATLYRLLTGRPPFEAGDALGLAHAHVAVDPAPPETLRPDVPPALSRIVLKLLAKMPEGRYQTAAGLAADLERCRRELAAGAVPDFPPATQDAPERLQLPQRLYGREAELSRLLAALENAAGGGSGLVLVTGPAGVGKSSLVRELLQPARERRGLFLEGKFDAQRHHPLSASRQALDALAGALLAEGDEEQARHREAMLAALRGSGKVLTDLAPSLERVLGPQLPAPELVGPEAQRRLSFLSVELARSVAGPGRPLVLFMDDLQWADLASLELLRGLLAAAVPGVLVAGAYRDDEVDAAHPLSRWVAGLREEGVRVERLGLEDLDAQALERLVADVVPGQPGRVRELARAVRARTGGNPLFVLQTLQALVERRALHFEAAAGRWEWDGTVALEQLEPGGSVQGLVLEKLRALEAPADRLLPLAACLGFRFAPADLAAVVGQEAAEVVRGLEPALRAGLLQRLGADLRFAHDRIHEATYAFVPADRRAATHLQIARALAARSGPDAERDAAVFQLADQYNLGSACIEAQEERDRAAALNLSAGRRALKAVGQDSARAYLRAAEGLLGEDRWQRQHALAFEVELRLGQAEFLLGELTVAERRLSALVARAASFVDRAAVTCLLGPLYTTMQQVEKAACCCLDALREVGIRWPPHPAEEMVAEEFARLPQLAGEREIEGLLDLPALADPDHKATLDVLGTLITPAFFSDPRLLALVGARMANLSIEHGNGDSSCWGYLVVGEVLGSGMGDQRAGYRFGKLAIDLVDRSELATPKARIYVAFGGQIVPWTHHLRLGRRWLDRVSDLAMQVGDVEYASYGFIQRVTNMLDAGDPLEEVERVAEEGIAFTGKAHFPMVQFSLIGQLRFIRAMRGLTPDLGYGGPDFDEAALEAQLTEEPSIAITTCFYRVRKLQARLLAGDHRAAAALAEQAERVLWTARTFPVYADFHLHAALARAALHDGAGEEARRPLREALARHHAALESLARDCPENFAPGAALVGAEIARIEGRDAEAMRLYEDATAAARHHGFVQLEALANELAAAFFRRRGLDRFERVCLAHAAGCYERWGALGKVRALQRQHPWLASARPPELAAQLDTASVAKAHQAISAETLQDRLALTLLRIAMEHAGAQRGWLVVEGGGALQATMTRGADGAPRIECRASGAGGPTAILDHVRRSREAVVLADAAADAGRFSRDEYLSSARPRSVLCMPVARGERLLGLLYLENGLVAGAFTPERRLVLDVLAAQAAISLEMAAAHRALRESEAHYRRMVDTANEGIWALGPDLRTTFVNARMAELLGTSPEMLLGKAVTEFMLPEDVEAQQRRLEARRSGASASYQFRLRRADGRIVWALAAGTPVLDEAGRFQGAFAMLTDVTERVRAEEEVRALNAELQRHIGALTERSAQLEAANRDLTAANRRLDAANTEMEDFFYSLSHDLRAPLRHIGGHVELLRREVGVPNQRARHHMDAVGQAARRMGTLIDDLLSFSRMARVELSRERVELGALAREVVAECGREAQGRDVRWRIDALPAVIGDRAMLRTVLVHLVSNALKFTRRRAQARIEIGARETGGDEVEVFVRDNGVGFDPAYANKLFGVFQRLHRAEEFEGTGIGLALVRRIIARHGGRTWARGAEGEGATFYLSLPGTRPADHVAPPVTPPG